LVTELLKKAFKEAEKLPEEEQEAFAAFLLDEMASERRWEKLFEDSADELKTMAEEARERLGNFANN